MPEVTRPVVRSFNERYIREAARYVRGGGHAIVWGPDEGQKKRATLVFRKPVGDDNDLGFWAVMDLGKHRYRVEDAGALAGLATFKVPRDCEEIVRHWVERDSVFEGPTRTMVLDCLTCGACCRDNRVILEDEDVDRFHKAGRADLMKRPYARKEDGRVILTLRRGGDKACKHLAADNKCGIYEIRPNACSTFPMGSECCLFAREEELGITDGAA
jgi:hypothetical protein